MKVLSRALAAGLVLAAAAPGTRASGIYSEGIGARALGQKIERAPEFSAKLWRDNEIGA